MKNLVVLSGAGISAESGLKTFRDADGLWEGYDVMSVASIEGWHKNPGLVLNFYNERRRQLFEVKPNLAHFSLARLEKRFHVNIVTQNVDDLHERAGSNNIIHLHGELLKSRSSKNKELLYDCSNDIHLGDRCELGSQLRPHIVWFGEEVPLLEEGAKSVQQADIVVIIGTSMQVYPAASLINFAKPGTPIYYLDPNPNQLAGNHLGGNLHLIPEKATTGMNQLEKLLFEI